MFYRNERKVLFIALFIIFFLPFFVNALSLNEEVNFSVDSSYDLYGREEITAVLVKITNKLYFYIDKKLWDKLSFSEKEQIDENLYNLSNEFETKIYPTLTSVFGSEPIPGIDKDEKITILIHQMSGLFGGYSNSVDVYSKFQNPDSNEREMIYLNASYIKNPNIKTFLAHEFIHLITTNQKELIRKIREDIWLNEARAEYAPTLLGYDSEYKGSNLEKRVRTFLTNPNDSLTEWLNKSSDYAVVNVFIQYLVDNYGIEILKDSMFSSKTGIDSIDFALKKNGFKDDFEKIFTNWTIAVFLNDCSIDIDYCYKNQNLKNLKIVPESNFIPKNEANITIYDRIKNWSAKWYKFFGGNGDLILEFSGSKANFKIPYILCDFENKCEVKFFELDNDKNGSIIIPDFSSKYSSLTLIPSVQNKDYISGVNELSYSFSLKIKTQTKIDNNTGENDKLIKELILKIESLKKEIERLKKEIEMRSLKKISCNIIKNNLYFGLENNQEVYCLQEFLKNEGFYPEGLITGNFFSLTKNAVMRFQEKYASEILLPFGLNKPTGYVGERTREKINQLLTKLY